MRNSVDLNANISEITSNVNDIKQQLKELTWKDEKDIIQLNAIYNNFKYNDIDML